MLNKSEGTIKNRQSKNMSNIAYSRHRTKSNKARTWATLRIQDTGRSLTNKNMGNIAYTRHRTKSNKARTWATLRIQDTGRSLTKQEHVKHCAYKTQDEV